MGSARYPKSGGGLATAQTFTVSGGAVQDVDFTGLISTDGEYEIEGDPIPAVASFFITLQPIVSGTPVTANQNGVRGELIASVPAGSATSARTDLLLGIANSAFPRAHFKAKFTARQISGIKRFVFSEYLWISAEWVNGQAKSEWNDDTGVVGGVRIHGSAAACFANGSRFWLRRTQNPLF